MDSENDLITCASHGKRPAAFICKHLLEKPEQHWFSDLQSRSNLHPDAWCSDCEATFQKLGGWADVPNEESLIAMVCSGCYDQIRAQSVPVTTEAVQGQWNDFVRVSTEKLKEKQNILFQEFKLNEHKRWNWDIGASSLIFSNDGVTAVKAKISFVGSISTTSDTWLWAWANESLPDVEGNIFRHVTRFGEESKFTKLTTPYWEADEINGWEVTAICANILDCKGAYRTSSGNGYTYLLINEIAWVS